jgi:ubiquinone/menaquinone biosynthesis C-methylase UbiE
MKPVIIDIGSGPHPKPDATHRMDLHQWAGVTQVHDLRHIPYPYETDMADKVYFGDVIEHLTKFDAPKVLKEIRRIMKPGATLEVTCPDVKWIMTQIVEGTWNENANVSWLRQHEDPWDNAMDYLFGGWRHPEEYKIPGMGHINGFSDQSLTKLLVQAGFKNIERVNDDRNPAPARDAVLKLVATK